MKRFHLYLSRLVALSVTSLVLLLGVTAVAAPVQASTVFPGMYPALTHSGDVAGQSGSADVVAGSEPDSFAPDRAIIYLGCKHHDNDIAERWWCT